MVRLVFEDTPGEVQVWESGGRESWQQWECSHAANSASCGLGIRGGSHEICVKSQGTNTSDHSPCSEEE